MPEEVIKEDAKKEAEESKKFHDRIKRLFINSGFKILKSDYNAKGADIIAEVDNKKIIVQCKRAWSDDKTGLNIDGLIDEYSKKAQKENAERAILAISRYKIPSSYLSEDEKRKRAMMDKVVIWDDKIIEYYEEVVSALNEWAQYTIIGDLYISSRFGDSIYAPAMKVRQGESEFFVFKISPEDLLKISYIFRRDYNPQAYQRTLNIKRLKKEIAEFLDSPEALLPTNLIGVFNSNVKINKRGQLVIPRQYKSFWIIDGQHRLYSFCYTKNQIQRNNFELVCVGLDGRNWVESQQAKLFVDINDKSKRISKLLLYDLYELIGIPEMRIELVKKLARESKIFNNKIKIHRKDKGNISLVTFVNTTPMGRLINERNGELGILFRERHNQFPNYSNPKTREKCKEFYFKIFEEYFGLIQKTFPKEWEDSKNYVLSTDRGIRVLLRLLKELYRYNLINAKKIGDSEIFKNAIYALKGFDFSLQNLRSKYLGEGGADLFLDSLKEQVQKTIPDFFPRENKKILHDITVEAGDKIKAKQLVNQWLPLLGKEVYGELPFINKTTFDYLSKLPEKSNIKLFVSEIWGSTDCIKKCEELTKKGYDIKIKKIMKFKEGQKSVKYLHERWIGGNNFELEPGYDLMADSLGNTKDSIKLWKKTNSERIIEFKERWNAISQFQSNISIENIFG